MHAPHSSDTLERLECAEQLKLTGKHEEALKILEALLMEDPENVPALEEVADNELSLGHFARAERAARRAVTIGNKSYTGHYILGFVRSHEEKWDLALKELKVANTLSPNNAEILRCLGWALFNAGQRAQGIVTLERALNLDQENPLTLCDLGSSYLQVQNLRKARMLFQRALEIDPENDRAKECVLMAERLLRTVEKR
ncbi:MAG: tetratricopeptide repeat protein [Candidatus Peribacteraceae bacterium]|nr:tetratricopeptide repeat protein [Candidatus Peribacteraceae bacterium]MDD5742806.1 tetratricopeptide repeat protein [Candidatus Peribacteraceae bacterium]